MERDVAVASRDLRPVRSWEPLGSRGTQPARGREHAKTRSQEKKKTNAVSYEVVLPSRVPSLEGEWMEE